MKHQRTLCHYYFLIPGQIDEIILEAKLCRKKDTNEFKKDEKFINGLKNYTLQMGEHLNVEKSKMVTFKDDAPANPNLRELEFISFPPGSVIAFR